MWRAAIKILKNIAILFLIIIKAEFKYRINLIFIRRIINTFKKIGNFECTLPSNKFFNLFHIIKVIILDVCSVDVEEECGVASFRWEWKLKNVVPSNGARNS